MLACFIVKDEAQHLAKYLDSLQIVADEIILDDTGSTDDTIAIAQKYTDRIYHYDWHDDFAAARNYGLQYATGDWILILDADETLPESTAKLIPQYVQAHRNQAIVLNWRVVSDHHPDLFSRGLFPNHRGIRFAGRVHEIPVLADQFLPSYHCQELMIHHHNTAPDPAKQVYYHRLMEQMVGETTDLRLLNHVLKHLGLYCLIGQKFPTCDKIPETLFGFERRLNDQLTKPITNLPDPL